MKVLGIETSCDETAVCLIEAEGDFGPSFRWRTLGNALISQAALHAEFGGVFPNLAKREHAKNLVPLLKEALKSEPVSEAKGTPIVSDLSEILQREPDLLSQLLPFLEQHGKPDIDAIAVTHGPGLEPALWVGINFAKALSLAWNVPIVAVNHMEGHIILSLMEHPDKLEYVGTSGHLKRFEFPLLSLLISGGHTELVLSKQFQSYELVGQTRDDAAGEAFDKVARLLALDYPGGPEISRLAAESRRQGLPLHTPELPRPMLHDDTLDFSFSGLKTAVRRLVEAGKMSDEGRMGIAREFEDAVTDVLVEKTLRAAEVYGVNTVVVGGGVSANTYIRMRLKDALEKENSLTRLLVSPPELATDNALMIALAGYFHAREKDFSDATNLSASGNLRL